MKKESGITLIALVVTIIILLILAGVSITTLSGDGLFGRAESSAAKYEQASQAENSTLSALMDKYDNYDKGGDVLISWSQPIASRGSFINNLNPKPTKTSNLYDKQVIAVKPDGTQVLLNPYQAQSIRVPDGTKLRFCYYIDTASTYTYVGVQKGNNGVALAAVKLAAAVRPIYLAENTEEEGSLRDGSYHYIELTASGYSEMNLRLSFDDIETWESGGETVSESVWVIVCNRTARQLASGDVSVSWSTLATRGSYINSLNPTSPVNSNYSDKEIIAIKPDGTKQLINPYTSGNITVPKGTKLRFYTYSDKTTGFTVIALSMPEAYIENFDADGKIMYYEYTLTNNTRLSNGIDAVQSTEDNEDIEEKYRGKTYSIWGIDIDTDDEEDSNQGRLVEKTVK